MTQDEIISMAREAGMSFAELFGAQRIIDGWLGDLERFAALVAANERENSAKMQGDCTLAAVRAEAFAEAKEHFGKQLVGFRGSIREQALEEAANVSDAVLGDNEVSAAIRRLK